MHVSSALTSRVYICLIGPQVLSYSGMVSGRSIVGGATATATITTSIFPGYRYPYRLSVIPAHTFIALERIFFFIVIVIIAVWPGLKSRYFKDMHVNGTVMSRRFYGVSSVGVQQQQQFTLYTWQQKTMDFW